MTCGNCGTTIADKAIVCYRCGVPTAVPGPAVRPAGGGGRRSIVLPVILLLAGLGAGWFAMPGLRSADPAAGYSVSGLIGAALLVAIAVVLYIRRRH